MGNWDDLSERFESPLKRNGCTKWFHIIETTQSLKIASSKNWPLVQWWDSAPSCNKRHLQSFPVRQCAGMRCWPTCHDLSSIIRCLYSFYSVTLKHNLMWMYQLTDILCWHYTTRSLINKMTAAHWTSLRPWNYFNSANVSPEEKIKYF